MISRGVGTCVLGKTIGTEKDSLEMFSVLALDSVPTFAPKIEIPALAAPSMPEDSDAVTATTI